jgi:hypothetical protein
VEEWHVIGAVDVVVDVYLPIAVDKVFLAANVVKPNPVKNKKQTLKTQANQKQRKK